MRVHNQCAQFIKGIMNNKNAGPFNEPVDYIALGVPDYPTIITHPMDFGTVETNLASGKYSTVDQMAADCRLVFSNARTFNPDDHIIHKMATELSKLFEKRWETLEAKLATRELGQASGGANKEWIRACKGILKGVQNHAEAYPFLQPVDWRALGIPDYPKIIKKPMDLSKVDKRLSQGGYSSVEPFVGDMQLIFTNAKTFNLEGSQIHVMAQNVEDFFLDKYSETFGVAGWEWPTG